MTDLKSITLSHFNHKEIECIRIDFAYDQNIKIAVSSFNKIKWSQNHRCFYIPYNKENLKKLTKIIEKVAIVNYVPAGQKAKTRKIKEHDKFMSDLFIEYSSLFISYSFIDKDFVNKLNDSLRLNGVKTFLWEKDAPFGETLKNIMFENVHKYDRVLFVASENSLKSPACQFELSQAREKQDKIWKTILFPIHIDNFLFEVRKENIRPKDKNEEYWKNICELREINSLNFKETSSNFDKIEFENKIKTLLKNLKNN